MKKSDIINKISQKTKIKRSVCEEILDATLEEISNSLKNGEDVMFFGFGKFEVREYKARNCFNPSTGKIEKISASKQPCFKPGDALRKKLR